MSVASLFATSQNGIPEFQANPTKTCLFFCETEQQLLLTPDQGMPWDLPGDNFEGQFTQAVALEIFNRKTQLSCTQADLIEKGICYLRHNSTDRMIHLFRVTFASKPASLSDRTWIPLFAFQALDKDRSILRLEKSVLREGRLDTFNMVFDDRVWHRVQDADNAAKIILQKGTQRLSFDLDHRLLITILGKPVSGKFTQAELLARSLGLRILISQSQSRTLSLDDICREEIGEIGEEAPLQKIMDHHDEAFPNQSYPCQLTTGLFSQGICKLADLRSIVLRGYPSNVTQCAFLLNIFLRSTDQLFALSLEPSDEDVRAHPKFPDDDATAKNESRLTEFNHNQALIKERLLAQNYQVKVLKLPITILPSVAFHQISVHFQNWLDGLATQQAALEKSKKIPAPTPINANGQLADVSAPKSNLRNTAIIAVIALGVGFVAGAILIRRQH